MTKKDRKPLVSIVILNWNRVEDTLECLRSVRALKYPNTEVIVVDNGSVDHSKAILKKVEDIIFVNNKTNKGFTGGHIDGLKVSRGEYILILNNDAVINENYLDIAIEQMKHDEQLGAIGGRAYEWNEQYPAFNTSNPFFAYQNINPITGEAIFDRSDKNNLVEVNNVSGSGVVLRRSVINHIGYLYDPFFAYYEETDLFARMKRANYRVKYHPELHIWHKSGSSSSSYFQFNQLFKNRFLYAIRNFEQSYIWPF